MESNGLWQHLSLKLCFDLKTKNEKWILKWSKSPSLTIRLWQTMDKVSEMPLSTTVLWTSRFYRTTLNSPLHIYKAKELFSFVSSSHCRLEMTALMEQTQTLTGWDSLTNRDFKGWSQIWRWAAIPNRLTITEALNSSTNTGLGGDNLEGLLLQPASVLRIVPCCDTTQTEPLALV